MLRQRESMRALLMVIDSYPFHRFLFAEDLDGMEELDRTYEAKEAEKRRVKRLVGFSTPALISTAYFPVFGALATLYGVMRALRPIDRMHAIQIGAGAEDYEFNLIRDSEALCREIKNLKWFTSRE